MSVTIVKDVKTNKDKQFYPWKIFKCGTLLTLWNFFLGDKPSYYYFQIDTPRYSHHDGFKWKLISTFYAKIMTSKRKQFDQGVQYFWLFRGSRGLSGLKHQCRLPTWTESAAVQIHVLTLESRCIMVEVDFVLPWRTMLNR